MWVLWEQVLTKWRHYKNTSSALPLKIPTLKTMSQRSSSSPLLQVSLTTSATSISVLISCLYIIAIEDGWLDINLIQLPTPAFDKVIVLVDMVLWKYTFLLYVTLLVVCKCRRRACRCRSSKHWRLCTWAQHTFAYKNIGWCVIGGFANEIHGEEWISFQGSHKVKFHNWDPLPTPCAGLDQMLRKVCHKEVVPYKHWMLHKKTTVTTVATEIVMVVYEHR